MCRHRRKQAAETHNRRAVSRSLNSRRSESVLFSRISELSHKVTLVPKLTGDDSRLQCVRNQNGKRLRLRSAWRDSMVGRGSEGRSLFFGTGASAPAAL